jgi:hypothetical protein
MQIETNDTLSELTKLNSNLALLEDLVLLLEFQLKELVRR